MSDVPQLLQRLQHHDRLALSRLLTLAAQGHLPLDQIPSPPEAAADSRMIAFIGGGGVGKSSLIGRLVEYLRERQQRVAVLCCDPQSPLTGGALLGDRIRISQQGHDAGVFIRSLATRGGQQAIAAHLDSMARLLHAFGFANVLVETVGAGQGDTAVAEIADVVVVVVQPESGDAIQWEKAGILEVADIVVVHKADLPGADQAAAQLGEALHLPGQRPVPIVQVSSAKRQGLAELWSAVGKVPARRMTASDRQSF
ncbi:MAG: ArgK/MeaB family GTPase [Pirellulales bacterium]